MSTGSNTNTLYFYDLETSGFDPRSSRIMQFAGQRTSLDLKPIGAPDNILIKITPDCLPSPDAIMVTGITPQQTIAEGMTEAEFLKLFHDRIAEPGTIFLGFNSVRFDDEFMRFLHYRNFYDAYEWQWKDGRSRWDLLDVVRMTRALRPEGMNWPFDGEGKPGNRLEQLSTVNKLAHANAHDALSDVLATIELARLLRKKQPKLFDYLLSVRDKKSVAEIVDSGQPFIYTSGKYPGDFEKTTVVAKLTNHPKRAAALVFDLRQDPEPYLEMSAEELVDKWQYKKDSDEPRLPVKTLAYNRCPAVAPISVLDDDSTERLKLDKAKLNKHINLLRQAKSFTKNILKALEIMDKQQQSRLLATERDVDGLLYDDFFSDEDRQIMQKVKVSKPDDLSVNNFSFKDSRLTALLPLYKARNYPKNLTESEQADWDKFVQTKLEKQLPGYFQRISELQNQTTNQKKLFLLEELSLYGQSLMQ